HLRTVVLPNTPVPADSPYAWLNFRGRWGQLEAGINNGPFGPASHDQWEHPISWADSLRTSSVTVPGVQVIGISATSFFCSGTTDMASMVDWGMLHPAVFLSLLALLILGLSWTARQTTWRPFQPEPLRRARDGGQILRSSRRVYRQNAPTFIGIG